MRITLSTYTTNNHLYTYSIPSIRRYLIHIIHWGVMVVVSGRFLGLLIIKTIVPRPSNPLEGGYTNKMAVGSFEGGL